MAPDLKKIPAKNYMAPDPANFVHQLPQKESGGKLYGSRSRQLSSSAPSKRIWRKIITQMMREEDVAVLGLNSFSQPFKAEFG